jgi:hypothetical protein
MKRPLKQILLVVCALMVSFDQPENPIKLNPAQLKEDVLELRKALEKNHPGLYWYTSKEQFNNAWDSLTERITQPMADDQFLKLVLPVVAKVKCAHTLFYPSKEISTRGVRFPLNLKFLNGKAYILGDSLSKHRIPDGSELISVNGKSLADIVQLMLPSLEAQGGNIGWKYVILDNDFQNYYYYIIEQPNTFDIEYIEYGTEKKVSATVDGSTAEALKKHWKNWYPNKDGAPLNIKFLTDPDVAIITIKSFTNGRYQAYQQDADNLIDQYFEDIRKKGTKNLIIDIRGNEGGNNPENVYKYIARENDKDTWGSKNPFSPAKNAFQGNVILLMNERSISAQETFVSIFKNNKRGLTIGQPTPGSYNGFCGGNKRKVILPHSKFEIRIPLHAFNWRYTTKENYREGEGFPPDFKVSVSINDVLNGQDPALALALSKIQD